MDTLIYIIVGAAFYLLGYFIGESECRTENAELRAFKRRAMSGYTTVSDETDSYPIEGKSYCVHEMECKACGHAYEHVYGDYEFCPMCGRMLVHETEGGDV